MAEYVLRRRLFCGDDSSGRVTPPALRASNSDPIVLFKPIVLRRIVSSLRPTLPPFSQPYGQYHQPSSDPCEYSHPVIRFCDSSKIDCATFWCRGGSVGRSPARLLPNSWPSKAASGV